MDFDSSLNDGHLEIIFYNDSRIENFYKDCRNPIEALFAESCDVKEVIVDVSAINYRYGDWLPYLIQKTVDTFNRSVSITINVNLLTQRALSSLMKTYEMMGDRLPVVVKH